jgi:protein-tyrosine phosphatase
MSEHARIFLLEGGLNFRELGGYHVANGRRVKFGRLFRSGATDALTARDRAMLESLEIRSIFDLRSNQERLESPHGLKDCFGITYHAHDHDRRGGNLFSLLDSPTLLARDIENAMLHMYQQLPYELADIYRALFQTIAKGSLPLVFNCAAGKDRTGVAAALLLSAIGVNWDVVLADYQLSQQFVPAITRKFSSSTLGGKLSRLAPALIAPVFDVRPSYLVAMREAIIARSGSIDAYLRAELGLNCCSLGQLRRQLLD